METDYHVNFDDSKLSSAQLKDLGGHAFHSHIVGALLLFALANVLPRDVADGTMGTIARSISLTGGMADLHGEGGAGGDSGQKKRGQKRRRPPRKPRTQESRK